jgi:APA family basic amino acid/polyamine antiporter
LDPVLRFGALFGIGLASSLGIFVLKWSSLTDRLQSGGVGDVSFAFAIAALVCLCTALALADLAARHPSAGGAFSYCHRSLGPFVGNLVGWCLVLEFTVVASSAARGWAGTTFPIRFEHEASLPAAVAAFSAFLLLLLRIRIMAAILIGLVAVQLVAALLFAGAAVAGAGEPTAYMPAVAESLIGSPSPAIVLFLTAMTGFEVVAMAGEDAVRPRRTVPWAIVTCVLTMLLLYFSVTLAVFSLAALPATSGPAQESAQLVLALAGDKLGSALVTISTQVGYPAMLLALCYAQVRLYLAMSRRRLLPGWFARVSTTGIPIRLTLLCGAITALLATFGPPETLIGLAEAILPFVFAMIALSLLISRWRSGEDEPETEHGFEVPLPWFVAAISLFGCGYVFFHLSADLYWQVAGWLFAAVLASLIAYFRGELPSGLDPAETIGETTAEGWLEQL